jgi:membrane associated rhomboid family serine protease
MIHIFLNSYFLYQAGPEVESRMDRREFLSFFLGNTLFVALCLWHLSSGLTIGISGFCMALLSYLYMDLQATRHPMANQVLTMLMINVGLGLFGNISFVGHAAGAVFGVLWWMWRRR